MSLVSDLKKLPLPVTRKTKQWLIFAVIVGLALMGALQEAGNPTAAESVIPTLPVQGSVQEDAVVVERVVDGDTFEVRLGGVLEKVRMVGMNTPESVDPRRPVECFGKEASKHLQELIEGKTVRLHIDSGQGARDKYGRLLRYVFLGETHIGLAMIADGYAYEYTYDKPYEYQAAFKAAEASARNAGRGLWSPETCNGEK